MGRGAFGIETVVQNATFLLNGFDFFCDVGTPTDIE